MKTLLLAAVLFITALTVSAQVKPFKFEGAKRKYLLYLPESYQPNPSQSFPLVFNFHGGGMTVAEQMFYSRMNEAAEKHNFIVVYPAGVNQDWNVGFDMSYQKGTNDIGYIKALLDTLKRQYRIDQKAVFATGLSRGGFFCHRLAAEMPEAFAAIASVGGPLPDSVKYFHKNPGQVSMMQVHGTADEVVKYDGKATGYASADSTFHYWMERNRLSGKKETKQVLNANKKDSTSVIIREVSDKNASVALVTIENGGHTWPGSDSFNIGYPLGHTTKEIDINDTIWRFFAKNKKR
ncbi:PHB depolymerase family esterase [Rufibacter glacialis]|uniref:PHB depolymerase family esterase n=1 Tax=Rufibacter glacialis TaxID=1259555 RepID=A0A5M8Q708_9BACT|nr:PHB depolymerase family esterase [Rufibacter glacialis]KAA6431023.1 hypothetical protein FOE74_18130 [Rufibacter glacialis]